MLGLAQQRACFGGQPGAKPMDSAWVKAEASIGGHQQFEKRVQVVFVQ